MKIIGLTGVAGSGKDTVGQMILDDKSGYVRAISDPLKRAVAHVFAEGDLIEAARELFALTEYQVRDVQGMAVEVPFWGVSGDGLIDRLGTALESEFGEEMWCRIQDGARPLKPVRFRDRYMKEQELEGWSLLPSQIIEKFGDAVRGEFGADVLLRRAELDLNTLRVLDAEEDMASEVVVYTDIRTDDEALWVRQRGGVVVEIIRDGVAPVSEHKTEQGVSHGLLTDWLYNEQGVDSLRMHLGNNLKSWLARAVDIDHAERIGEVA